MKRIKIVAIALFTLATIVNVNAQDSNNHWACCLAVRRNFPSMLNDRRMSRLDKKAILSESLGQIFSEPNAFCRSITISISWVT